MGMSKARGSGRGWTRMALTTATILMLTLGGTIAQRAQAQEQEPARLDYVMVAPQAILSSGSAGSQVPQDVRIMQRIISTALSEVEAPELPEVLADDDDTDGARVINFGDSGATVWRVPSARGRSIGIGGRDVTGFYMQGYGYLFTVEVRVRGGGSGFSVEANEIRVAELEMLAAQARRSAAEREADEARAAGEAERTLEEQRQLAEQKQAAWDEWSAAYRERLADALHGVVAQYGSTLTRATPDESITFIADFGGGDEETVTLTARRGDLSGASREQNLSAVQMAIGGPGVSDSLQTELRIMEEIIDSSQQTARSDEVWVAYSGQRSGLFGRSSSYQYVPGYGVLYRKSARLNVASNIVAQVAPGRVRSEASVTTLRQRIDESTEEQTEAYRDHLDSLKQSTAEILATYGPTLTQMNDDDWVGIFYNVGSAAGLLEGGMTDFLVQARMSDIRAAAGQADSLAAQLVTNEKQD